MKNMRNRYLFGCVDKKKKLLNANPQPVNTPHQQLGIIIIIIILY